MHFRFLVFGLIVSMAYDILWLIVHFTDLTGADEEDGGMESSIRQFSFIMALIAIPFKVIMCIVYWMASLRFEDIMDESSALLSR